MNQIIQEPPNTVTITQYTPKIKEPKRYKLQFWVSFIIAAILLFIFIGQLYQNSKDSKIAQDLLNSYQLTTLYSDSQQYNASKITSNYISSPFVIGMIKIDKIDLTYPILSESNDDLLKISLCRFTGPNPNDIGNLCIAGHNYVDNTFFSRLNELEIGDLIEIYDLSGESQNYYVYQKYEVEVHDLSCTTQDVGNNKIVTLLTCNNLDNNKRLVVQAK